MLGIDLSVWLALLLSLAGAVLCVVYGLTRWNADDDTEHLASRAAGTRAEGVTKKARRGT